MLEYRDLLNKQQFLTNFCMSLTNKYLCAPVPKAAHTTLKLLLAQLEIVDLPVKVSELRVHDVLASPFIHMYQLPIDMRNEVLTSPGIFRFAVVRDPYDRITSCYLDKIARESPERVAIARRLGLAEEAKIGFVEFLRYIASQETAAMDMHWKPQTAILLWDRIQYDFIGRMESFSADADLIFRRITGKRAAEAVIVQDVRHHATDATRVASQYVEDPIAKALIHQIYDTDFSAFSYSYR